MTERLKYRWQRTYEGSQHDFSAWDGDMCIGRVYLHKTGPEKFWTWYMSDESGLTIKPAHGYAMEKMDACRELEEAYIEALKG